MPRGYIETVTIARSKALAGGGLTRISDELPMGQGWHALRLRINTILVVGTGTGAIAEGELLVVKNIRFTTDKGEVIYNIPGRAMYKYGSWKAGSPLRKDAVAAANGTYRVNFLIPFSEHIDLPGHRPIDTILDTKRYNACYLEITLGGVADLLGTVGTSSVTFTCDIELVRDKGILPQKGQPKYYLNVDQLPPVDASVVQFVKLIRSGDLAIKRLFVHSCATGTSGVPWSGANADDVQDLEFVSDQNGDIIRERIHQMIQEDNKDARGLETILTGVSIHDFVKNGSLEGALVTAGKPELQYKWTNQAGVASGDLVSVAVEGIRGILPY